MAGLEGLRGLAALVVMLHHTYLLAYPGFPRNNGPAWLTWLLYGHFAVVVFIVLSGFSLAVAPARAGWQLGDVRRFFYKRAWRILPTYWPALLLSLVIAWTITNQPGEGTPGLKSVVVNGLLVQDIFGSASPNGAFWSIPIEVQLYLAFPLLIWLTRRFGAWVMVSSVTVIVIAIELLAPRSSVAHMFLRFTPQLAALFALGAAAAGILRMTSKRLRLIPWLTLVAALPVIGLIAARGPVWSIGHLFWLDLALGPAIALLIAGVAIGRPARLVAFLDLRPLRSLGDFSYSLYATHAPIVVAWYYLVINPLYGHGNSAFVLALLTGAPLSIIVARLFAAVFELPFTRAKSWPVLRSRIVARLNQRRSRVGDLDLALSDG